MPSASSSSMRSSGSMLPNGASREVGALRVELHRAQVGVAHGAERRREARAGSSSTACRRSRAPRGRSRRGRTAAHGRGTSARGSVSHRSGGSRMWPSASTAPSNERRLVVVHGLRHGRERTLCVLAEPEAAPRGRRWTSTIPADIQATLDALDDVHRARRSRRSRQQDDNDPVLRPPPRVRAHRLRERRRAPRRTGRSCSREMRRRADAAGWLRLRAARGVRRPRRQQPRDGDHPRAPRHQGPRPAQRPAERELDRRQLPDRADDARLRHRRSRRPSGCPGFLDGTRRLAFGLTEPNHGSDATYLETTAVRRRRRVGDQRARSASTPGCTTPPTTSSSPAPRATRARRSASPRSSCRPTRPGSSVDFFWWTFNMPTDHAEVTHDRRARAGDDAVFGRARPRPRAGPALRAREPHPPGGVVARRRAVLHRRGGRLRQRAASPGASALSTQPGHPVPARRAAHRGGDAAPAHPLRRRGSSTTSTTWRSPTSWRCATTAPTASPATPPTGRCRPAAASATRRHMPFEHIYRHHRRYRITEGSEEIQMRKVGQHLFKIGR